MKTIAAGLLFVLLILFLGVGIGRRTELAMQQQSAPCGEGG